MLASVSGAFVAHLLLLVFLVLVPKSNLSGSAMRRERTEETAPREVTVMMADLLERIEREKPETPSEPEEPEEPEPEPEPPLPEARPFITTDLNRPETAAPESAPFESDRNTSAAARRRPDPTKPQEALLPTLSGINPLPSPTLANREYVDGELEEPPAASPDPLVRQEVEGASFPAAPAAPSPAAPAPSSDAPSPNRSSQASAAPPPPPPASGNPDLADRPPDPVRDPRGGGEELDAEASMVPGRQGRDETGATLQRSFLDRSAPADAPPLPELPDGPDRLSAGKGSGRGGETDPDPLAEGSSEGAMAAGIPNDSDGERQMDSSPDSPPDSAPDAPANPGEASPPAADSTPPAPEAPPPGGLKPADDGLFAKGFSPQERENLINGMIAREGENAVDAEATALGRYKKAVRDAISQTWHRYRQDNADFVTWGILKIEFRIDRNGRVGNLRITKNEANAMLAEFSLRAIRDARLPPMPPDVAASVGNSGLVIQYDIIIY